MLSTIKRPTFTKSKPIDKKQFIDKLPLSSLKSFTYSKHNIFLD